MPTLSSRPTPRPAHGPATRSVVSLLSVLSFLAAAAAVTGCDVAAVDRLLDDVRDGGADTAVSSCAAVLCAVGTHCEEQPVMCVRAPCPPIATCVPDAPKLFCGGIAGIKCPGVGQCVDDPTDGCDPKSGGADCGGICQCVQTVKCDKGQMFDSGLKVCACVPAPVMCGPVCDIYCEYGNVVDAQGCPTCKCNPPPTPPVTACATVKCAAGTHCEEQVVMCIQAPCPPIATCVPDAPKVSCGGIAGIKCPGGGQCVDDPADSCDPKTGGADCGGICQCVQKVDCAKSQVFDSSVKVCACVPAPVMCGPVCAIYCEYGNVVDAQGCPTCKCNPAPTSCPPEKCTGPAPKSANYVCPDGVTVAGPACQVAADGSCGWTVLTCPATTK